jgi:hypothetical protein
VRPEYVENLREDRADDAQRSRRTEIVVAAFRDGRFLVAWNTEVQTGPDTTRTRVRMRFVR